MCCESFFRKLNRRKTLPKDLMSTPLKRCLNISDLTMIGVGNMLGAGVFLLSGIIAREKAGPGVVLSYLLSGFAVFLSSLCYAEYGARVPKAGSAYTYAYMTLGELWAFIVGWDVILERMLSAAALARGWSSMLDSMFNGEIRNATLEIFGEIDEPGLSEYPDLLALTVTLVVVALVSIGVKFLANLNMILTLLNISALCIIIGLGFWKADWNNWTSEALGGFLPYGFQGVVAGSATLFYTFVGFESISIAGEEAKDPATQIPIATFLAMMFTTVIYTCAGAALTLMVPFTQIDINAPFPEAFRLLGLNWAVYVVAGGALFGITTSIFIDHFALPRTVYSMASDGIFFRMFSWVYPLTQTPIIATGTLGIIAAFLALLVDYKSLVEFLSIGTLMSFIMVAISVIINRYRPPDNIYIRSESDDPEITAEILLEATSGESSGDGTIPILKKEFQESRMMNNVPGEAMIGSGIVLLIVSVATLTYFLKDDSLYDIYGDDRMWILGVVGACLFGVSTAMFMIGAYEETNEPRHFSVPLVPYTPALSIAINTALLVHLPLTAWWRYGVWLLVGLVIYFGYGIRNSEEKRPLSESGIPLTSYSSIDNTEYEEN